MNIHYRSLNMIKQRIRLVSHTSKGFTLVELMISLSIGLVLFAGVMSIFVGMRTTTAETSSYGELQENGRFAISILTNDLLRQNFWGDLSGTLSQSNLITTPDAPAIDCEGEGVNNATFPQAVGPFRTLWGKTIAADGLNPLGCFTTTEQTRVGSDVIQIKRVISFPEAVAAANNYYLVTNLATGGIFAQGSPQPDITNSRLWEYQHHVYYVRDDIVGDNTVPVLMQGRLANFNMNFSPIIDGIEQIRFMYGVDTETSVDQAGYGIVNAFISADNMTPELWDNAGGTRILAVKIFVLARNINPDMKYTDTNTYQLGDLFYTPADEEVNYRRLLFSSTVTLYNNSVDRW